MVEKLLEIVSRPLRDHLNCGAIIEVTDIACQLEGARAGVNELAEVHALHIATDECVK
jgi:hypothetical protein